MPGAQHSLPQAVSYWTPASNGVAKGQHPCVPPAWLGWQMSPLAQKSPFEPQLGPCGPPWGAAMASTQYAAAPVPQQVVPEGQHGPAEPQFVVPAEQATPMVATLQTP